MGTGASGNSKNMETHSSSGIVIFDYHDLHKEAMDRNLQIERELAKAKREDMKTVKLLLLGGSESGKSTFAKQMKILHLNGFSESELINYRYLIYSNIALVINQILRGIGDLKIDHVGLANEDINTFKLATGQNAMSNFDLTPQIGSVIKRIWTSKSAQDCYKRRSEIDLLDSAKYFLDDINRISDPKYSPSTQDILRSRAVTVGIYEITFHFKGYFFRMVDVGGQKTERRKWIHCFDNVTAIMFVSSLSEYDQYLAEDRSINRMHDSLALFRSISNNTYFAKTPVLLFLNKKDIFMEKIQKTPLEDCFPKYQGTNSHEEAGEYILRQFLKRKPESKHAYCHFTMATDTKNIEVVFAASIDTILKKALTNVGVY